MLLRDEIITRYRHTGQAGGWRREEEMGMKHFATLSKNRPAHADCGCTPCQVIIWLLNRGVPGASWLMDMFKCWVT
jgi:hypothetical protein